MEVFDVFGARLAADGSLIGLSGCIRNNNSNNNNNNNNNNNIRIGVHTKIIIEPSEKKTVARVKLVSEC